MMDILLKGLPVSTETILTHKEQRFDLLNQLSQKYSDATVLSITLNIPGNIKNNCHIQQLFQSGLAELCNVFQFNIKMKQNSLGLATGPEAILVVNDAAKNCKHKAVKFEEAFELGRLFDVDVFEEQASQISRTKLGFPLRSCYVCEKPAKVCARSQAHSPLEIKSAINNLYHAYVTKDKETSVSTAIRAMLYEVSVTPKPGLVDLSSQGSHPDMDVFLFINSAESLRTYFSELYDISSTWTKSLPELFKVIRNLGIVAEKKMLEATDKVNTHKGAIFSLGILFTAHVYQKHRALNLREIICQMLVGLTKNDFKRLKYKKDLTAGEAQFLTYGILGIRGEAEAGFPSVFDIALPYLRESSGTTNRRLLDTFMTLASVIEDTNLLKRAVNLSVFPYLKDKTKYYFELGGAQSENGMHYLYQMDKEFTEKHLTLGGTADLLILTIFLGMLEGIV